MGSSLVALGGAFLASALLAARRQAHRPADDPALHGGRHHLWAEHSWHLARRPSRGDRAPRRARPRAPAVPSGPRVLPRRSGVRRAEARDRGRDVPLPQPRWWARLRVRPRLGDPRGPGDCRSDRHLVVCHRHQAPGRAASAREPRDAADPRHRRRRRPVPRALPRGVATRALGQLRAGTPCAMCSSPSSSSSSSW